MTALITAALDECEFTFHLGPDAVAENERLGVPGDGAVAAAVEHVCEEDVSEAYLDRVGDITGLVTEKRFGNGSTISVRVDMDVLERTGSSDEKHRPTKLGFASTRPNEMYAYDHDGHTVIGLGIARVLGNDSGFDGTLQLLFQPAEGGGHGGKPISETDLLANIDYFLALHPGLGSPTGTVIATYENPPSSVKPDVAFKGASSRAGNAPNRGRNTFHTAAATARNLYGTLHHAGGTTHINVGEFESFSPQNTIAEEARLRVEVRGGTADLDEYMLNKTQRALDHVAGIHNVSVETRLYGKTATFTADDGTVEAIFTPAADLDGVTETIPRLDIGGSEDASYLIRHVQEHDGETTYIGIDASNEFGHHTSWFDIDGDALDIGVGVVCQTIRAL